MEDFEAAKLLFNAAMSWAKGRGLDEMIGPKGFTALNGLGILTRGFEHRPALGILYNHPYYADFLKRLGFVIDRELESGYLHHSHKLPEKIHLIAERVSRRWGLQVKRFESRADLRKMLPYFKILYNGSLVDTSGNSLLTDDGVKEMSEQIL